jgi:hypothetical protein
MEISVFDYNRFAKPEPMGTAIVDFPLSIVEKPGKPLEWWVDFEKQKYGQVLVAVTFTPA